MSKCRTTSCVFTTTLGTIPHGTPEVIVTLGGPRGGRGSCGSLSPAAARQLAYDLLMAADEVEAPDPVLHYRGYLIEPHGSDGGIVDWIRASWFNIYPDGHDDEIATTTTLNQAREFINGRC